MFETCMFEISACDCLLTSKKQQAKRDLKNMIYKSIKQVFFLLIFQFVFLKLQMFMLMCCCTRSSKLGQLMNFTWPWIFVCFLNSFLLTGTSAGLVSADKTAPKQKWLLKERLTLISGGKWEFGTHLHYWFQTLSHDWVLTITKCEFQVSFNARCSLWPPSSLSELNRQ